MPKGIISDRLLLPRFWARVQKSDGCWLWLGSRTPQGYGQFSRLYRRVYAHRFSYELANGPIPAGLEIDHLCNNPPCVRPTHLRAVTHLENMARSIPGAANAAKTECPRGHPYVPSNTYTYRGRRNCRECNRARLREYKRLQRRADG